MSLLSYLINKAVSSNFIINRGYSLLSLVLIIVLTNLRIHYFQGSHRCKNRPPLYLPSYTRSRCLKVCSRGLYMDLLKSINRPMSTLAVQIYTGIHK